MNILIFGGTRFFGIYLVEKLLKNGHEVTIATRGLTKDQFGDRVKRLIVDRCDEKSLSAIFIDKEYDCIIDNICYTSNDVKRLLETAKCKRYILTSTMSVYPVSDFKMNMKEEDFDPLSHPLKWYERQDAPYDEIKRQAEAALFQIYSDFNAAAVRFPYVIGRGDYTKRLYFYVEHVLKQIPMDIDNLKEEMSFIQAEEAAEFLMWMAMGEEKGCFNAANEGTTTIEEILSLIEKKSGKKAVISKDGERAPYNGTPEYSINTKKAQTAGFQFSKLQDFLPDLLNFYIEKCLHFSDDGDILTKN